MCVKILIDIDCRERSVNDGYINPVRVEVNLFESFSFRMPLYGIRNVKSH